METRSILLERACEARDPEGLVEVLGLLVQGARERLGRLFAAAWLQGSLSAGDFDALSDVDFVVVVREEVPDEIVPVLQTFHEALFEHPCHWAQHLEGSYVPIEALREPPPPRRELLFLDHGSTTFERSDHDHYLAVFWILRERGVVLAGPPPRTWIAPVPREALVAETLATMHEWGNQILNEPDEMWLRWRQAFAVLTYCRMWHTLETGEIRSKRAGMEWAKGHVPEEWHDLIDFSWAQRQRWPVEGLWPAEKEALDPTRGFLRYVLSQVG